MIDTPQIHRFPFDGGTRCSVGTLSSQHGSVRTSTSAGRQPGFPPPRFLVRRVVGNLPFVSEWMSSGFCEWRYSGNKMWPGELAPCFMHHAEMSRPDTIKGYTKQRIGDPLEDRLGAYQGLVATSFGRWQNWAGGGDSVGAIFRVSSPPRQKTSICHTCRTVRCGCQFEALSTRACALIAGTIAFYGKCQDPRGKEREHLGNETFPRNSVWHISLLRMDLKEVVCQSRR